MSAVTLLNDLISIFDPLDGIAVDSLIITVKELRDLQLMIGRKIGTNALRLELLYRGSRDGFTAKAFHSKVDGHCNTVILIHSEFEHVFGGYTQVPWSSKVGWHTDDDAFVFILRHKDPQIEPVVYDIDPGWSFTAVYHEPDWMGCFGYCAYAFCIYDGCDSHSDSFSVHSTTYKTPHTLAGKPQFAVVEYEVFQITTDK